MRFRSFQARIVVFVLSLLVLMQVVAFVVVNAAHMRHAREEAAEELLRGGRVFERLLSARAQRLAEAARLLSGDFAFKTAYALGDAGTVRSALQNHQARIGADMMALVSPESVVVADTLHPTARQTPFRFPDLIRAAEDTGEAAAIVFIDGRPFQMVIVPLVAPVPIAWIGMGFVIDGVLAEDLQHLTTLHVSFVSQEAGGGWSSPASTLPAALRWPLLGALPPLTDGVRGPVALTLDGREYVSHVVGLGQPNEFRFAAVLQKSLDEAFEPLYRVRARLLALFASGLLVSLVGGIVVARTVSRPVETLVASVRQIEKGDYTRTVTIDQQDELGELAAAITHMTVGIAQREHALRTTEEQFRQAQKMEAVGRLAGGIAHDFNNLLSVITGRAELLRLRVEGAVTSRRDLDLIVEAAARAGALTRQLLAFSRKQVLQPRVLDLNVVVTSIATMLRRVVGEDIDLMTVVGANLGRVKADPAQMEQIIMNLVVNARDAMPNGGRLVVRTANVDLDQAFARRNEGARPGPHVMLTVSDSGEGMPPEVLRHAFEPFFTTKEPGKGTGLGLATVYGIVRQHNGSITVESEPGRGTALKISLPRVDEAVEPVAGAAPAAGAPGGSETIMVVEDEDGVRSLACEILQLSGYTVLQAPNGSAALRLSARYPGPIQLLLTDVVMPEMGGRELSEGLTALRSEMRVLYMSGYTDDATLPRGLHDVSALFLQKPFTPTDLARKVREVLGAPWEADAAESAIASVKTTRSDSPASPYPRGPSAVR